MGFRVSGVWGPGGSGIRGSQLRVGVCWLRFGMRLHVQGLGLVAEGIHFTLFGIILPTIKLKVYAFWGL